MSDGHLTLAAAFMDSSSGSDLSSSEASDGADDQPQSWADRGARPVNHYPVSLQREQELSRSAAGRRAAFHRRRDEFLSEYELEEDDEESIINTPEALALRKWCSESSWSFCGKCGKLCPEKLLPNFREQDKSPVNTSCKCGAPNYVVPQP